MKLTPPCGFNSFLCHFDSLSHGGRVQVIVRVRPLNKKEEAEEAEQVVHRLSATGVSLADQLFTYDAVAGEDASQVIFCFPH